MQMSELNNLNTDSWFYAYNPLLEQIPIFKEFDDVMNAMAFNPLEGIDINSLSFVDRVGLLAGEKSPLEPTMKSVRTAITWHGMLMNGLRTRNPTIAANRAFYYEFLRCAQEGNKLPISPTKGMSINVIKGPTGTGKTVTHQRFCACLPQVIDHGRIDAAGWNNMRQLVYLNVDLSHDGTRGGFLVSILCEMDKLLGTNYAIDLRRQYKTVETLAVATIGRLYAHFTGIIFVDEAQLRNIVKSPQAGEMQMFLLKLMNSGIPLVFSGNECAFDWLTYSQDKSRFALTQESVFSPIGAMNEPDADVEWDALFDGVSSYYLLKKPITNLEMCSITLRRCSGGIARLALTLWSYAQTDALYEDRETITPADIQAAYESASYDEVRTLADGFHYKKSELLALYPDVNDEFYEKLWRPSDDNTQVKTTQTNENLITEQQPKTKQSKTLSGRTKLHLEQERNRKKDEKRAKMFATMSPDDIRQQGLIESNLTSLENLRIKIEKGDI